MCPRVRGQQNPPAPEGAHGRPFRRSPDPLGRGLLVSRDGPAGLWTHTGCPEAHAVRVLCSAALVTVNVSCLCHWLAVGAVLRGQRTATSGDVCGCRGWVRGTSCRQVGGAGTLQTPSAWDGPPRVPRPGMREPKEAPPPPSLLGRLELEFDPLRAPSRIQSPTLCYRLHADSTHPGRLLTGLKGQHSSATGTPGCRSAGTSKGVLSSELHPNAPRSRLLLETVCHAGLCWHPPRTLQVRPVLSRPKAGLHPPPHCDPGARSCCGGPSSTPAPTHLVPRAVPSRDNHRCPQVPSAPCRQNHLA